MKFFNILNSKCLNFVVSFQVRAGLRRLSQRVLGPCSPLQAALPHILSECKQEFFERILTLMKVCVNVRDKFVLSFATRAANWTGSPQTTACANYCSP